MIFAEIAELKPTFRMPRLGWTQIDRFDDRIRLSGRKKLRNREALKSNPNHYDNGNVTGHLKSFERCIRSHGQNLSARLIEGHYRIANFAALLVWVSFEARYQFRRPFNKDYFPKTVATQFESRDASILCNKWFHLRNQPFEFSKVSNWIKARFGKIGMISGFQRKS